MKTVSNNVDCKKVSDIYIRLFALLVRIIVFLYGKMMNHSLCKKIKVRLF